jgi:hypothetical protein
MKATVLVLVVLNFNIAFAIVNNPQIRALSHARNRALPLTFEPNRGQVHPDVQFVSRTPDAAFFFSAKELAIGLAKGVGKSTGFRVSFEGCANLAVLKPIEPLPSKSNYLDVDRPTRSITGIENYAAVEYQDLYPGINVRYYGTQHKMEHDFRIVPGADPSTIKFHFHGIANLRKTRNGDLRFEVDDIPMTQTIPIAYQVVAAGREPVRADYVLLGNNQVGFSVHNWDGKHLLVIDPILANSTYLGGDTEDNSTLGTSLTALTSVSSISSDAKENVYITGTTTAIDFPVTNGAFQTVPSHVSEFHSDTVSQSGFVTKLGKFGTLIYSTYLLDSIAGGSVGPDGHVYVVKNGFNNFNGPGDGIDPGVRIVKLNLDGSKVLYDYTFAGSPAVDCSGICTQATSVAATFRGIVWIAGTNTEVPLKTTPGAYQATSPSGGANLDGFVLRLDTNKTGDASIMAATYIGGSNGDDTIASITVDRQDNAVASGDSDAGYFVGQTTSSDFPKRAEFNSGGTDTGFFAGISADGKRLIYSALLHDVQATSVTSQFNSRLYVGGSTTSTTFPVSGGALQKHNAGKRDGVFLAFSIAPDGEGTMFYSTYVGGSGDDAVTAVASIVDSNVAFGQGAAGWTESLDFPTSATAFAKVNPAPNGRAAFVMSITNIDIPQIQSFYRYSTYVGPVMNDTSFLLPSPAGMTMPNAWNAWIAGTTDSPNYPTKYSPVQASMHGLQSGFVSKIVSKVDLTVTAHAASIHVRQGDPIIYHIRVVNHGPDPAEDATLILDLVGPHPADRTLLGVKTSSKDASCPSASVDSIFCSLGPNNTMPPHAVYYIDVYMRATSKTPVTYPFFATLRSATQELTPDKADNQVTLTVSQP